jgi:hypothetical protein
VLRYTNVQPASVNGTTMGMKSRRARSGIVETIGMAARTKSPYSLRPPRPPNTDDRPISSTEAHLVSGNLKRRRGSAVFAVAAARSRTGPRARAGPAG